MLGMPRLVREWRKVSRTPRSPGSRSGILTLLADGALAVEEVAAIKGIAIFARGALYPRPPGDHVTVCTNYYETKNTKIPTIITIPPHWPSSRPVPKPGVRYGLWSEAPRDQLCRATTSLPIMQPTGPHVSICP